MDKQSVFDFLRAELDRTHDEYVRAKERFYEIAGQAPTGLPHPDGTRRVENAARVQATAMLDYAKAIHRFNDFVLDGTIPEELKNAPENPVASEKGQSEDTSKRAGS